MNCDLLARPYRALEYAAFGRTLEKQRFAFLQETEAAERALILGEGDGRFVCELAALNHTVTIDCIESSSKMIQVAQRRLAKANVQRPERISFLNRDAKSAIDRNKKYDLIVSHFFLDCFSNQELQPIVDAVQDVCLPSAKWLIAEFQQPDRGWRKWHARCWLRIMYLFFSVATSLDVKQLPDYRAVLTSAGFELKYGRLAYAQMIGSELWQLPSHLERDPA